LLVRLSYPVAATSTAPAVLIVEHGMHCILLLGHVTWNLVHVSCHWLKAERPHHSDRPTPQLSYLSCCCPAQVPHAVHLAMKLGNLFSWVCTLPCSRVAGLRAMAWRTRCSQHIRRHTMTQGTVGDRVNAAGMSGVLRCNLWCRLLNHSPRPAHAGLSAKVRRCLCCKRLLRGNGHFWSGRCMHTCQRVKSMGWQEYGLILSL
jgi:hypothetical protein